MKISLIFCDKKDKSNMVESMVDQIVNKIKRKFALVLMINKNNYSSLRTTTVSHCSIAKSHKQEYFKHQCSTLV